MKVNIGRYPRKSDTPRKISVKIDPWDTWSMDYTLALIIHPMLVQLKETKQGSPWVDDEDVPDHLKSTSAPPKESDWDVDDNHHLRWDYVLDEMIFTFESLTRDWEGEYFISHGEHEFIEHEDGSGNATLKWIKKPEVDREGMDAHGDRIKNGLRLFGKYYMSLWD